MAVTVRIPTPLRTLTGGQADVEADGETLRAVLTDLENRHSGIESKILGDDGEIRRFINVFVNGDDVRHIEGLGSPVKDGDEISIVPAIAGGF